MTSSEQRDEALAIYRIGEVARLLGLTTRTLRYWQEIGLLTPSGYRDSGERMYTEEDLARIIRIRELQVLLGFSLAEVRMAVDTEDVIDRIRSEYQSDTTVDRRLQLLDEAAEANDRLLVRLDDTLARVHEFRDERAEQTKRLQALKAELSGRGKPASVRSR